MPGKSASGTFENPAWWKEAVVYQVWPSSFKDSNGDGIGDLQGVISKLDYLKSLGVDVLWTSPIYKSPQKDMGYDISDYRDIHEVYGSLKDYDALVKGLHERGMKLMMDLVVNHTSDNHVWFKESRSSKNNPKRDWYIWRSAIYDKNGERHPPNNWASVFCQDSAWSWDETTQEYYLRMFTSEQPDLNWENPEVRHEVHEIMRYWLDRGADGFRMDVINLISKPDGLLDAPKANPGFLQPAYEFVANGPRVHEYLQELNREVLCQYDTITVGETPGTHDPEILVQYSQPYRNELQMVFTFELHDVDGELSNPLKPKKFDLRKFKDIISKYQKAMYNLEGWNSLYLENHDQARSVTRFGDDSKDHRHNAATLLAMLHTSLSGTVYVYQGEEIGTACVPQDWGIKEYKDIATTSYWESVVSQRRAESGCDNPDMSDIVLALRLKARDNARTPVQWDNTEHAGFSETVPWMRVNEDYPQWNVAAQMEDKESVRTFWKDSLSFRKEHKNALVYGEYKVLSPDDARIFAFIKHSHSDSVSALVVLNFSKDSVSYSLNQEALDMLSQSSKARSNYHASHDHVLKSVKGSGTLTLDPYQGFIFV